MARENAVSISEKDSIIVICTIMIIMIITITIKLNLAPLSCGLVTYMYIVPLVRSSNHNHAFIEICKLAEPAWLWESLQTTEHTQALQLHKCFFFTWEDLMRASEYDVTCRCG